VAARAAASVTRPRAKPRGALRAQAARRPPAGTRRRQGVARLSPRPPRGARPPPPPPAKKIATDRTQPALPCAAACEVEGPGGASPGVGPCSGRGGSGPYTPSREPTRARAVSGAGACRSRRRASSSWGSRSSLIRLPAGDATALRLLGTPRGRAASASTQCWPGCPSRSRPPVSTRRRSRGGRTPRADRAGSPREPPARARRPPDE
jgi:hypothetical protein